MPVVILLSPTTKSSIIETARKLMLYHFQQMDAGWFGEKMCKFFVEQTNPVLLIDFAGVKVFDEQLLM